MDENAQSRLQAARRDIKQLGGADSQTWRAAFARLYAAEREAAAECGQQYATPIELGVQWDDGAPLPHLIAVGSRAYVVCRAADRAPDWDGATPREVSRADERSAPIVLIELLGCREVRHGGPNDEARGGHPLAGYGLETYGAFEVHNSQWIDHVIRVNSVHPDHSNDRFRLLRHYALLFHDDMVEALADSIAAYVVEGTMRDVLITVVERMTS